MRYSRSPQVHSLLLSHTASLPVPSILPVQINPSRDIYQPSKRNIINIITNNRNIMSSPSSSSTPWEDRRGMFQRGKDVHDPARRRPSQGGGGGVAEAVRRASVTSNNSDPLASPTLSSSSTMEGQRRRVSYLKPYLKPYLTFCPLSKFFVLIYFYD